jgi:hypothetical protein
MSDEMKREIAALKATDRRLAAGFALMVQRFDRLDRLIDRVGSLEGKMDSLVKSVEGLTAEVLASRSDRLLFNKSFGEHHAVLTDHELRLTRLELRAKRA